MHSWKIDDIFVFVKYDPLHYPPSFKVCMCVYEANIEHDLNR